MNSTTLAHAVVRNLIEQGVGHFVISPGSRNAPLSIALYEASQAGFVELHTRIDERGAAFFALGLAKASNNYVAVLCTSGTAVANYHPAALEAYHSDNKLLVISADRPARLRRTGANQTTLQDGLLTPLQTLDISSESYIPITLTTGPVHLNIQFEEPLLPSEKSDWLSGLKPDARTTSRAELTPSLSVKSRGVLIVGHDRANFSVTEISKFADSLGWPMVAEDPLSFSKSTAHAALFLSDPEIRQQLHPEQIIVIGRTTLSRSLNSFIGECSEVIVIDPRVKTVDTARTASQIFSQIPDVGGVEDADWIESWNSISKHSLALVKPEWSEQAAVSAMAKHLPDGAALFVGSSRPIRDIEAFAHPRSGVHTFANRGLAGIDGNISCAFGISEHFERTFAVVGDLTFLHDLSALVNQVDTNLTIFVIDNNGGGIFNTLPQNGVAGFETIFGTPHGLNIEAIIKSFGLPVTKVKGESDLIHSINHQNYGLNFVIIEVPDRLQNAKKLKEITQSLVSALRIGSNFA